MKYRIEHDTIGEIKVEECALWGAQTQRSFENFVIGDYKMPLEIIHAIAAIKYSAAVANEKLGKLSKDKAELIQKSAKLIIDGKYDDQFPLVVWQTGSGTQTNMNVNEVIAHIAPKLHANDDVNMSQSTNDVFPSAISVATCASITCYLLPATKDLIKTFKNLEDENKNVIKVGRTHLQDATPVTFGQEVSAWRVMLETNVEMINSALNYVKRLPLGGTAVGTGLNSPANFDAEAVKALNDLLDFDFEPLDNKFYGLSSKDAIVNVHGAIKSLACNLMKIANDIRLLASGPRCGLGEINIPANEPGSSIMPGKVNPTQCEALTQVVCEVIGNDTTITLAASQGNFQLNAYMPVIAFKIIESINLLSDAIASFNKKCAVGISVNLDKMSANVENSLMTATALNTVIGYEKAAELVKYAHKNNVSLYQANDILKIVDKNVLKETLNPKKMI